VISSFGDSRTKDLFQRKSSARARKIPEDVRGRALDKLDILDASVSLEGLARIPGNRLEALQGDLAGYHSIRINDQWRIVFKWEEGAAKDVRVDDYH
jgi:proteic killer suppression protein